MTKFTLIKKLKTNNRFNYTPRYYRGKEGMDPKEHATRFDMYADTYNQNDISGQWNEMRKKYRNRSNSGFNKTVWMIIAILVFLFLWLIDFDLSIFTQAQ